MNNQRNTRMSIIIIIEIYRSRLCNLHYFIIIPCKCSVLFPALQRAVHALSTSRLYRQPE